MFKILAYAICCCLLFNEFGTSNIPGWIFLILALNSVGYALDEEVKGIKGNDVELDKDDNDNYHNWI